MSCSPARLRANRQNALKSTGPKTPEGKAASRLNTFQHGMAGQGDLIGPGEDLALVAKRSAAFAKEFHASGEMGQLLAQRAALLSVRMERLAHHDLIAVAANAEQGRNNFDADRLDEIDRLVAELDGAGATSAIALLQEAPDAIEHLIAAWGDLHKELESDGPASSPAWNRAVAWLGLDDDEADLLTNLNLIQRIDAEVARLELRLDSMTGEVKAIAQARTNAGILASFDPSLKATLARRYEAAAERGMYRAIRTIRELNRAAGRDQSLSESTADRSPFVPIPPELLPLLNVGPITPLASFRAAGSPPTPPTPKALEATAKPTSRLPEDRKKRPAPMKAARKLALARR